MFGQAINCLKSRSPAPTSKALRIALIALATVASIFTYASTGWSDEVATGKTTETIVLLPRQAASWGADIGFVENGPRTGAEIQLNFPQWGGAWMPQFGLGARSIDIEGHLNTATTDASEIHSASFVYVTAKFENPYSRGAVQPYAVLKLGALLTDNVANSNATGAGYLAIGGEFPFAEMIQAMFSSKIHERTVCFFVETGVDVTSTSAQATSMQGSPFIFNGISSTVGFKYNL